MENSEKTGAAAGDAQRAEGRGQRQAAPREVKMEPLEKQMLDDVFDAFSMLASGGFVSLMHVGAGITRFSMSAVEMLGLPGEYIPDGAMDWNGYLHPEDRKRYMDVMAPLLDGTAQTYDISYRIRLKNGEYGKFRAVGAVLRGSDGKPSLIGGATVSEGLTKNVDPVTALPNRYAYEADLARKMAQGKHTISLMPGIGEFARINQIHGYTYGNRVLQETAWMLQELVKGRGQVYRMEGASFAVLSETMDRAGMAALYDMIRYRCQRGIEVNGIRNILAANGGLISTYTDEIEAATILSCLKYAYEESRQHMHGELVDYDGSIKHEGVHVLGMLNTIRDCVAEDCRGFFLEYDPVIDARTEAMNGAEALLFWQNPRYGRVGSEAFLPVLARDFLFEELGDFLFEHGLRDGVRFLEKKPDFLLCLNVYRIQLESDFFLENLLQHLAKTGFPAAKLSLKFEKDCRYLETDRLLSLIQKLHERKITLIIDGFGSGTDSIAFLKHTPMDAVCIDSQFIEGIADSRKDRDILSYLSGMAATCVPHINIRGVKDRTLRELVREMPITTLQGEYFSKPLDSEGFIRKYLGG